MIYYPTDKLDFGKYHGVQAGLVYLLAPGYIKWAIREPSGFCLGDIDFLSSLKIIDLFGKGSWVAHDAGIDVEVVKDNWANQIDFEDVKFSGYKPYRLPEELLEINLGRLTRYELRREREIIPENERDIFIFYPNELLFSQETTFTPTKFYTNSKDADIITFVADNSTGSIKFLPHEPRLKISSFHFDDCKFDGKEIRKRIEESKPFVGKIENGYLNLVN